MTATRITHLEPALGLRVQGEYTLTQAETRSTQSGDPFKVLKLVDYTGSLRVYAWENSGLLNRVSATAPISVHATLYVRRLQNKTIANLQEFRVLEASEVTNAAAMQCLDTCPAGAHASLGKLVDFVDTLQPEPLCAFLNRVLLDPRIAPTLTTCKGSQKHHHRESGGLLTHSVEAMEIAGDMARSRLSPLEQSITQVAALLHDLGKLRSVGSGAARPVHYLLASHESQTMRLLDPHLEWLRTCAPDIAAGLEYTLSFLALPPSGRGQAHFLAGELIIAADHMSAALQNHRRLEDLLAKTLPPQKERTSLHSHPGHWRASLPN